MTRARHWTRCATLCWGRVALFILALISGGLAAGCAGIFQKSIPSGGRPYYCAGSGDLRAGFAKFDITPARHLYLGGFDLARRSTGVQSKLEVRAVVLQAGDKRFAIVGVDNLGLMRDDVEWIKSGVVGVEPRNVLICASHTHAAPDLIGLWGFYYASSGRDLDYLKQVRDGVVGAVARAVEALEPVTLRWAQARLPDVGYIKNSRRRGLFNRQFSILQALRQRDGAPAGALLHLACHPEMFGRGNTLVSADFCGGLCDAWAAAGLGQAVFVNGELGAMVTPGYSPRGAQGIPLLAEDLLQRAAQALADADLIDDPTVEIERREIYLPLESPGLSLGRTTTVIDRDLYDGCVRSSVGHLRIGSFEAALVPGEMEPVLASEVRRALRKPRLVIFGLCDDEVGYLLREQDARDRQFHYERLVSPGVRAGEIVRAALLR